MLFHDTLASFRTGRECARSAHAGRLTELYRRGEAIMAAASLLNEIRTVEATSQIPARRSLKPGLLAKQ